MNSDTLDKWQRHALAGILGFMAGVGGQATTNWLNPPRPDPFTGTDGRELRQDLMREMRAHDEHNKERFTWLTKKLDRVETDLYKHLVKDHNHAANRQ